MTELLKNLRRAAKAADLIEIRADSIRDFSLPLLLKQKINPAPAGAVATQSCSEVPIISGESRLVVSKANLLFRDRGWVFTCSAKANGGWFNGAEPERIKLLSSAISSGRFKYVTIDIPESLKIPDTVKALISLGCRGKTGIILAYHNYRRTPDNLEAIYKRISACLPNYSVVRAGNPDAVKIVTYAREFSDNFKIFKLARRFAARRSPKLIAFCMGDKGLISRILYKRFGLFLTYASYKFGRETAEGQIPFEHMKYVYRADRINRDTKIFGLLGNPIGHSYSPLLFNGLFGLGNINAVYLPFEIEAQYLRRDFSLIKSFLKPGGFSVTSPYKMSALRLADKLSPTAKQIGAINTIYKRGRKYPGTNTDWIGVIETLWPLRKLLKDRQVFVLGKGGAARAILYALRNLLALPSGNAQRHASLSSGIKTTIFSRRGGKNTVPLSRFPQYCLGPKTDQIIINATPIGMLPDIDKSPVPKTCLKKGMIVFDTIYNPAETRLLKDARKKGCITVNGLKMFLVQAMKQMECFTRNVR